MHQGGQRVPGTKSGGVVDHDSSWSGRLISLRFSAALSIAVLATLSAAATGPQTPDRGRSADNGAISGAVVDGRTGLPIPHALVRLTGGSCSEAGGRLARSFRVPGPAPRRFLRGECGEARLSVRDSGRRLGRPAHQSVRADVGLRHLHRALAVRVHRRNGHRRAGRTGLRRVRSRAARGARQRSAEAGHRTNRED